jgi:hypothetical protein
MSKKKVIMYDPPEGWKYGFPKPIPQHVWDDKTIMKWIVEEGYPEWLIAKYDNHFYSRYWEEEIDDNLSGERKWKT